MRAMTQILVGALLVTMVVTMSACEDSKLLAPGDSQILVTIAPNNPIIDVAGGETSVDVLVSATIFDANNFPLQGISVTFASTGGTFANVDGNGIPLSAETDENGTVRDTLTISATDPLDISVTAMSGVATGEATVSWDFITPNGPPVVLGISANPGQQQTQGQPVTFTSSVEDPDNDPIVCYQWTFTVQTFGVQPPVPSETIIRQGPTFSQISQVFSFPTVSAGVSKIVDVSLLVSDDVDVFADCGANDPILDATELSPFSNSLAGYQIVCDLSAPTVTLSDSGNVVLELQGGTASRSVSGSVFDGESGIDASSIELDCGNGTTFNDEDGTCTYTSTGTFPVRLEADNGCGEQGTDSFNIIVRDDTVG